MILFQDCGSWHKLHDFDNYSTEQAIVDQYIETSTEPKLRRLLLKENAVDMKTLMEIAKTFESSSEQAGKLEKQLSGEFTVEGNVDVMDSGHVTLTSKRPTITATMVR